MSRALVVVCSCALTLTGASVAGANTPPKKRAINTTQRIATLLSSPQGAFKVGTSDGEIAGRAVHGALRATTVFTGPSRFTAAGRLFYPAGALRYTLGGTDTPTMGGGFSFSGQGKFIGGTGGYAGARGSFVASGTKPANSYETWTLRGTVSDR